MMRFDWFGWSGRNSLMTGGPRWFVSRYANGVYISMGGVCAVSLPWFWSHAAIEARGYDRGWNAGYEAGASAARRQP